MIESAVANGKSRSYFADTEFNLDGLEIESLNCRPPAAPLARRQTAGDGKKHGAENRLLDTLAIEVGPKGRDNLRQVVLSLPDGRRYCDRLWISSRTDGTNYPLENFLRQGAGKFGMSYDAFTWATSEILEKAKEADAAAKQLSRLPEFPAWTAAELADAADLRRDYYIDRILAKGEPMLVGGPPKSLKTGIAAIELGLSLATGLSFLNAFNVTNAIRVGIMSSENGLPTLVETTRRVAVAKNVQLRDVEKLIISDRLPILSKPEHLHGLARFIEEHSVEVLILDPAYMMLPDLNPASLLGIGETLGNLGSLCRKLGATPIIIHHTRKNLRGNQPLELSELAGAGFSEYARQWLLLSRRERYQPGSGLHRLWLVAGGSAGHSGQWAVDVSEGVGDVRHWSVRVHEQDAKSTAIRLRSRLKVDAMAILKALQHFPDGETAKVIKNGANLPHSRFTAALKALEKRGRIAACEVRKPNRQKPYPGWKTIVETPPSKVATGKRGKKEPCSGEPSGKRKMRI